MKREYKAKIRYKMFRTHPDYECVPEGKRNDFFEYEDIYKVDPDYFYSKDHIMSYIKRDLSLVAGGGYNNDHIWNVSFDIKRIA